MTREEAIKIFNTVLFFGKCDCSKEEVEECFKMAIKALEQEPILDKIRAEIENDWQLKKYPSSPFSCGLRRAVEIIDKYKAESEVKMGMTREEPKSEWEHDYEILRAYSDGANEVLDNIRAEIETKYGQCDICEYFEDYDYEENDISEYRPIGDIIDILQIIDKYKAETEEI